jgi:hypothetical protein
VATGGGGGDAPVDVSTTRGFFTAVLETLGLPTTGPNLDWLVGWANKENTKARYNPLATTLKTTGSSGLAGNPDGVQEYTSGAMGVAATAQTLKAYPAIIAQFASGNALSTSYSNPAELIHAYGLWSGNAGDPAAAKSYFQAVKVAAQGGNVSGKLPSLSAAGPESWSLTDAANAVTGAVSGVWSGVVGPVSGVVAAVAKFFANIDIYLLRGGLLLGAALLLVVGLGLVGKSQGASLPAVVPV